MFILYLLLSVTFGSPSKFSVRFRQAAASLVLLGSLPENVFSPDSGQFYQLRKDLRKEYSVNESACKAIQSWAMERLRPNGTLRTKARMTAQHLLRKASKCPREKRGILLDIFGSVAKPRNRIFVGLDMVWRAILERLDADQVGLHNRERCWFR